MNPTESTFTCSYQGHENEPIVSFCVNLKCKDQFQCCSQCLVKKHQDHRDNCQTIIQVNQIIRKGIVEIPQWKSQSKQVFQKVSQIYQVFAKLLSVEQNKLIQLEKQMKKEDFYLEYKDFIQIKYNNKIQRLFSKIQEKNYYLMLNEMQKFEETLLSFGFFSSKSSRNQSQLNRESEILNIDEKRSQLLEPNIDIICQNKNCSNFRQYCKYCKLYNNQKISLFSVIESNIGKQIVTTSKWMSQAMQAFEKIQELFTIIQFALEEQETQFKEMEKFLLEQDLHQFMNQKKNLKQWVKLRELYCLIQQKAKLPILLNKLELLSQTLQSQGKNDYLEIMNLNQNLLKKRVNLDDENKANEALSLANYLCRDEKQDRNISWFDRAIDINPNNFEAFYNKGHALSRLNRYEESINCFDKAICLNPNYPEAYYNIGIYSKQAYLLDFYFFQTNLYFLRFALNSLNRYEEALKFFDQAIKIKNNYLEAFINKGYSLSNLNRYEEAIICYNQATKINPQSFVALNNKGFDLSNLNRNEEAILCLNKALDLNPNYFFALINKGNALRSLNQNESAIKCYEQAININPKHYLSYLNKGLTLCNLNRYQEGIKCYDQAIQLNSKNVEILNKKGLALENQNLLKEAIFYLYLNWVIMNKPSIVLIKQSALTEITIKHSTIKDFSQIIQVFTKMQLHNMIRQLTQIRNTPMQYTIKVKQKERIKVYDSDFSKKRTQSTITTKNYIQI